jgi:carbamoyl-phosphate synthase small subunit
VIAHAADGKFDMPALIKRAQEWPGLEGMDLARKVTRHEVQEWEGGVWTLGKGYARSPRTCRPHVVAMDFGAKDNIFRNLVTPARGDGGARADPAGRRAGAGAGRRVPFQRPGRSRRDRRLCRAGDQGLLERDIPLFGICLGHQMLALAAGAQTTKMHQGHRGANHPVKRLEDGVVEITSMNHGFAVDNSALPDTVEETHVSLFDGSNCGIAVKGKRRSACSTTRGEPGAAGQLLSVREVCGDAGVNYTLPSDVLPSPPGRGRGWGNAQTH